MDMGFTAFVFAVAILVAVGGSLVLVGYLGIVPASFNFGWKNWLPTLLFPPLGPLWFVWKQRPIFNRSGKQLVSGLLLVLCAIVLLYQGAPFVISRMAIAGP